MQNSLFNTQYQHVSCKQGFSCVFDCSVSLQNSKIYLVLCQPSSLALAKSACPGARTTNHMLKKQTT